MPSGEIAMSKTKMGFMAQRDQCCSNCNAFLANPQANPKHGEARQGWCRAMPPQLLPTQVPVPGSQLSAGGPQFVPAMQGVVPPTKSDGWCRAWEPAEDEQNDRAAS